MQTMNAAETAVFSGADRRGCTHYLRLDVTDANGVKREWTNLGGRDFTDGTLTMSKEIESGSWRGSLGFVWQRYADNLTPFGISTGRYHDYARPWRLCDIWIKVVPVGAHPDAYEWKPLLEGRATITDTAENPGKLEFLGRLQAEAQYTSFIDKANSEYGDDDGAVDLEVAMQSLIDDWWDRTQTPPPTLQVPVASNLQVRRWRQQKMPLWQALMAIPPQIGWAMEERLQSDGSWALELYEPDRTQTTPDFTFEPAQIVSYGRYALDHTTIRNQIEVFWGDAPNPDIVGYPDRQRVFRCDATTPAHTRLHDGATVVANSSMDPDVWGPRFATFTEGSSSLIQNETQAIAFADAALADLSDPVLWADVVLPFVFWPAELNDYYRFKADGVRSNSDQDLAVQGITFEISEGGGRTTLQCKGKPGLPKRVWLGMEGRPGTGRFPSNTDPPPNPEVDVFNIVGRGTVAVLRDPPNRTWNYDQVLWFLGRDPDFTPSASNLHRVSRENYLWLEQNPSTYYVKAKLRDIQGNLTSESTSTAPHYADPVMPQPEIVPLLACEKNSGVAAPALNGAIPLLGSPTSGSADVASDTRWCAPSDGHYQISVQLVADAAPSAGTLELDWYNVTAAEEIFSGPPNGSAGGAATGFPQILDKTEYRSTASATSHTVPLPANLQTGEELVMFFAVDGSNENATATGWTEHAEIEEPGGATLTVMYRVVDGTEGSTIAVACDTAEDACAMVFRLAASDMANAESTTSINASGNSYNPPSETFSGGADAIRWFIGVAIGGSIVPAAAPAIYTNNVPYAGTGNANITDNTNSVTLTVGSRELNAATEDPPNIGLTGTTSSAGITLAVPPSSGGGGSNGKAFVLSGIFAANAGDCFELRLGGSGTVGTFNLNGCISIQPVDGTIQQTSRDNPDPVRSAPIAAWIAGSATSPFGGSRTGEILDGEPAGDRFLTGSQWPKGRAGEGEVQRWRLADNVFTAMAVPFGDEVDRSADADDSAFSAVAWDQDTGEFFGAGHTRDDVGTDYAFITQWAADSASPAEVVEITLSTLGTGEEIPTGVRVRSSDQTALVVTKRDTGTGRMFRVTMGTGGSIAETGSAVDDFLDCVMLDLEPIVTLAVGVSAGDLYAYDFDDLTAQQWTVDITTTYSETFRPEQGAEIRESADGRSFYMACGGGWSSATGSNTLYKFSRAGSLLWSRDVSARTTLANVDGVGPIATDATNGDVYAVVTDYNNGRPMWDIVWYSRDGDFRGSMRKTFSFDPQHWSENNPIDLPGLKWPPMRLQHMSKAVIAYFRGGVAVPYKPLSALKFVDPASITQISLHELVFDGLSEGDTPEFLTMRETSPAPGGDLLFQQSTLANRYTFREQGGSLGKPCLQCAAGDFYQLVDTLADFELNSQNSAGGLGVAAIVEPTTASGIAYPILTLWSDSMGEAYPLLELGTAEAVTVGDKYNPSASSQVNLTNNSMGSQYFRYFYDTDPDELTNFPLLIGNENGIEFFNNQIFTASDGNQLPSQHVRLLDMFGTTVVKGQSTPTHWYSPDSGNASAPPDEGGGTAVNASAVGTPTRTEGAFSAGKYFFSHYALDAGDGWTLADNADFDVTGSNDRTFEFLFSFDATPTGDIAIAQKMDAADGWALYWDHSALQFRLELHWNTGGSASAALGPVQSDAPTAFELVHIAIEFGTNVMRVWHNGEPGEIQTSMGDASNTSSVRIADADANFPVAVTDFAGKFADFGMWTSRLDPDVIWRHARWARSGFTPQILGLNHENTLRDHRLTIGRRTYSPALEFEGFIYKLWIVGLNGETAGSLVSQHHTLMRQHLPGELDVGLPTRTSQNDPRWSVCADSWLWCRFWEASGNFESETEAMGPFFTTRDGTATNVGAYQQASPNIRGAGDGIGGGAFEDFSSGYAITLADNSTVAFDMPVVGTATTGSLIHLLTEWDVSLFFKWDTGSVHTRGHLWSINLASGWIRCSIAANNIRVEWNDGTTTTTTNFTPESNPLSGSWQALSIQFSSGSGGALMDIICRHSGGEWYPALETAADALNPANYGALSASDEIVFGAGTNVPAGEEFEGDIAQVCISFGTHATRPKW